VPYNHVKRSLYNVLTHFLGTQKRLGHPGLVSQTSSIIGTLAIENRESVIVTSTKPNLSRCLLAGAALSYFFQLIRFGSICFHQIDIDGIDYIGIARHLQNHQFHAAINDFRSPLLSWMIAAGSIFDADFVRIGKTLGIGSFLLCGVLLYFFTKSLWHSDLAASLAVFWFTLCRGLSAVSVEMVTPDFLFGALVLLYFIVLLASLRTNKKHYWVALGLIHGIAFLAKAFALPWLALCTFAAVVLSTSGKKWAPRLALAGILPLFVAMAWAGTLHSKYGAFTTGTQFKVNFLQWTVDAYSAGPGKTDALLKDTRPFIDENNVNDPMPPGSWPWHYRINAMQAIPKLAAGEILNLPKAAKELLLVITPGGLIAFAFVVAVLVKRRDQNPVEFTMAAVVILGCVSLLLAYCMLVFDGRYLYPLIPLLLAIAVGFFLDRMGPVPSFLRWATITLLVLGILVSLTYSSSPFRTLQRDFQVSCYQAGQILRTHPGSTVVSVGSGPYQEHGVGWEAGYKSAYFGDRRLIGATAKLPNLDETPAVVHEISKAMPDAILVWGSPGDTRYDALVSQLDHAYARSTKEALVDPLHGEVGYAFSVLQH
jgi:hypothetical protein